VSSETGDILSILTDLFDPNVLQKIPKSDCLAFKILPVFWVSDGSLAVITPHSTAELKDLSKIVGFNLLKIKTCSSEDFPSLIDEFFSKLHLEIPCSLIANVSDSAELAGSDDSTEVRALKELLHFQIKNKASDLIFSSMPSGVGVSLKLGAKKLIKSNQLLSVSAFNRMLNVLKNWSGLDFSSCSPVQEGSFKFQFENKLYNFRVTIIRTLFGFSATLRCLNVLHSLKLSDLTLFKSQISLLLELSENKSCIKFICGPMGSGKTTLMAAILRELAQNSFVISIEDPPELQSENIMQIPVKKDLSMQDAFKTALRLNPDHIALGELRDFGSLNLAIQASSTGHSIFTTIHCYDVKSFVSRVESFGLNLNNVTHNIGFLCFPRLTDMLCPKCKIMLTKQEVSGWNSTGCFHCNYTGYSAKLLTFELYTVNESNNFQLVGLSFKEQWSVLIKKGKVSSHPSTTDPTWL
jgi:type II secretory ATPase GspE/PulE/Tfp pilus assembly ATPase PilB-like protein